MNKGGKTIESFPRGRNRGQNISGRVKTKKVVLRENAVHRGKKNQRACVYMVQVGAAEDGYDLQ